MTRSVDTVDSTGPDSQLVDGLKYIKNRVTKHPSMKVPSRRGRRILWTGVDGILRPEKGTPKEKDQEGDQRDTTSRLIS